MSTESSELNLWTENIDGVWRRRVFRKGELPEVVVLIRVF